MTPNAADGLRRAPRAAAGPLGMWCWRVERVDPVGDGGARTGAGGSTRTQRKRCVGHLNFWQAELQQSMVRTRGGGVAEVREREQIDCANEAGKRR